MPQLATPEALDYRTLCDAVCTKIRNEILSGVLKPGTRLQQTELAERFGISRMPVRDALRKLEAESLVMVKPGHVCKVAVLDLDELRNIYQIRSILEEAAARMVAPLIDAKDVHVLTTILVRIEQATEKNDVAGWLELNREFHKESYRHCQNPRLLEMIDSLWNSTQHFRRVYLNIPNSMLRANQQHRQILLSLSNHDPEGVALLIREHIQETLDGIIEYQSKLRA